MTPTSSAAPHDPGDMMNTVAPTPCHGGQTLRIDSEMEIAELRNQIDALDEEIVRLISERARAARTIGELKRTVDLPVYEPQREQAVFNHVRAQNPGPLDDAEMIHIYERIIDVMRTLQRRDVQ